MIILCLLKNLKKKNVFYRTDGRTHGQLKTIVRNLTKFCPLFRKILALKVIMHMCMKVKDRVKVFNSACELMFMSTAGNIFSLKHRRMSALIFNTLVFLKLNQGLL